MESFERFAVGELNETYERYVFNQRCQRPGESFEVFYSELCTLLKTCNYCDTCTDSILRDRVVLGIEKASTREELLRKRNLNLTKCVDICKAIEKASSQAQHLKPDSVHQVTKVYPGKSEEMQGIQLPTCKFCGRSHKLRKELCPAWGQICKACGKPNHFEQCCTRAPGKPGKVRHHKKPTRRVHAVQEDSSDSDWVNSVKTQQCSQLRAKFEIKSTNTRVSFLVDTGSPINILPHEYTPMGTTLSPYDKKLVAFNGSHITPMGMCRLTIRHADSRKKFSVEFIVVDGASTPIIGLRADEHMRLVKIDEQRVERVANVTLVDEFNDVFDGVLGCLQGEACLKTDDTIMPVVMPCRRVPHLLRDKLKDELDRLVNLSVLTPVDEPTPWVSHVTTTVKKDGSLRLCIDPHALNKALRREHFTIPVLDETLHEMSSSRVFTKVDLSSAYWHVMLDEESSLLTTMQTPFGRYRWLRLPFGTSVSAEIFQKKVLEALQGLSGVVCIADDVIVHGESVSEHDTNLRAFLLRCREKGIKLKREKLSLRARLPSWATRYLRKASSRIR